MNTKKWLAVLMAVVVLLTALLASCGKKESSSSNSKSSSTTYKVTTTEKTKPADPYALTKDDFSYGGRKVNGYTNYIDCIEKSGRTRSYWFSESSSYCQKANRGVDIGSSALNSDNKVEKAFGTPYQYKASVELPSWHNQDDIVSTEGQAYIYKLIYHGRTYYKIFYISSAVQWACVCGIEYSISI